MVLFDVSCLDRKKLSGIGIYAKSLSAALMADPTLEIRPVYKISRWSRRDIIQEHCGVRSSPYAEWLLPFQKYDLFHGPDFKIPRDRRHRQVVTVHDMAAFEPGCTEPVDARSQQARFNKFVIERNPDGILFPSAFSQSQFHKFFPNCRSQLFVTPLGCDHLPSPAGPAKSLIEAPYILYVGAIEVRKNVSQILSAFEALKARPFHAPLKLVLVGHTGFGGEALLQQMSHSKSAADILHLGYVPQKDLHALYQNALFFLYPSLYEGFGIPVIEAMKNGCPVLTSRNSAMSEVAGDAAVLVDPRQRDEIVETCHQLLMSDDLRLQLRERGLQRARNYTWKNCARLTADAYRQVLTS